MTYRELGGSWIAVCYGPFLAALGFLTEVILGGPRHGFAWFLVGLSLAVITVPWVYARRRFLTVRVTESELWQGREMLPLKQIAAVSEVGVPAGTRVLGGGWSVPNKYTEVPIQLTDDSVVLAWAKNPQALQAVLQEALES